MQPREHSPVEENSSTQQHEWEDIDNSLVLPLSRHCRKCFLLCVPGEEEEEPQKSRPCTPGAIVI